jgi:hypothetical protein
MTMDIQYIQPLEHAYQRMKRALFMPFDLKKWLVVGFTAFLADLLSGGGGGGGFNFRNNKADDVRIEELPEKAIGWLLDHPMWLAVVVAGVIALIVLIVVLTWLSSRGAFMFLHNVVHDRADVVAPWRDYRSPAHSLFLFRLCVGLAGTVTAVAAGLAAFFLIRPAMYGDFPAERLVVLILLILVGVALALTWGLVSFFTGSFVVPLMYKHNLPALDAWRRFVSLLAFNPWPFLIFAVLTVVVLIVVMMMALVAGCLTCCIGLILLGLPYVGSVVLLPLSYTIRAFSLEFLAQWGPDFTVFPAAASPQPPPAPPI